MQYLIILAILGAASAQFNGQAKTDKTQGKFVWDLEKAPLTAPEIAALEASKATPYPTLAEIPETSFQCSSKAGPGFYADVDTQCQVFHRCEQSGNMTSYLCVNSTLFNQITLICDAWYHVECEKSLDYEDFANSRLYTNQPLFDTPPADYVAPSQLILLQNQGLSQQQQPSAAAVTPKPAGRQTPRRRQ